LEEYEDEEEDNGDDGNELPTVVIDSSLDEKDMAQQYRQLSDVEGEQLVNLKESISSQVSGSKNGLSSI
jgi:hypothetical protein